MISFRLCLVTDRGRTRGRPLLELVAAALRGGVEAVQLREKDLSGRELYDLAVALRALCRQYDAKLLVNDRVDVALAAGADGVQLPLTSFDPADARRLIGQGKLIGASAHGPEEARAAAAAGADFVVLGPIFDTPSKRPYGPPLGVDRLREISGQLGVPVLAIGGVRADHASALRQAGAWGVAVVSAILEAADPAAAAAELRASLLYS